MKRWLSILIAVCVLLTASSVKAEEKHVYEKDTELATTAIEKVIFERFLHIKAIDMSSRYNRFTKRINELTSVVLSGDDAERIGLDKNELTNYLKLRIKNNFTGIKLETVASDADKYDKKNKGRIIVDVWIVGTKYPIAYLVEYYFFDGHTDELWTEKMMGCGSIDSVKTGVKSSIDTLTQNLAILFFKVRGEL